MPIYEYRCSDGHTFEVMQRISEDPLGACEVCGEPAARVYYPPAVHFKGSGFYNTDYGTRKRARENESGSGESGSSSGESGSSSGEGKSSGGEGKADGASSGGKESAAKKTEPANAAA
jgi:putative FmdB family regulatory protein